MLCPRQAYAHVFHQVEGVSRAASARWMLLAVATLPVNARGLLLLNLARTAAGSMLTVHPVFLSSSPPSVAATYLAQTHVLTPDSPYLKLVGGGRATCVAEGTIDGQWLLAGSECDRNGKKRGDDDAHSDWAKYSEQLLEWRARPG